MKKDDKLRKYDASEERQYMLNDEYEVYEKQGAPTGALAYHYHNFYEIIYIVDGSFASQVGDTVHSLKKGDFLLIDKNNLHRYSYVEGKHDTSRRIILWITDTMLRRLADEDVDLSLCFRENGSQVYHFPIYYEELLRGFLMKLATSEILNDEAYTARKVLDRGYLSLFFGYLSELCKRKEYVFEGSEIAGEPVVDKVNEYIDAHIEEPILIDDLAECVHMSKYYFVRRFKELSGVTVHTYLINKRLIKACELMGDGEEIMQVYGKVGFSDYSAFLRNFKRAYGISPKQYLKQI